jgi:phage gpG-like protein
MSIIEFSGKVRGTTKLKQKLQGYATAFGAIFAKGQLEKILLERTLGRFKTTGPTAQKDPSGTPWAPLSKETKRSYRRDQKLVDTGGLMNSIAIVRRKMSMSELQSPTGGGFSIGVVGEEISKYARAHQFGAMAGKGYQVRIPQRRFLGIGAGDVELVDNRIAKILLRQGLR